MEITAMERDQQIAAYRARAEELDTGIGILPSAEVPTSFLADAIEARAAVLPGWTPSATFYDDFTVVGGGVGSSWTQQLVGTGAISQPAARVTRLTSGTSGGARIQLVSFPVPLPNAGSFYCRARFSTPVIGDVSPILAIGVGTTPGNSQRLSLGFRGTVDAGASFYQLVSQSVAHVRSPVESDTTLYHTSELWWNGNGNVYGSVDGCPRMVVPTSGATAKFPLVIVNNGLTTAMTVDLSDYYCAA